MLARKYNPNSARPRIFDGAAEAKLFAMTLLRPRKALPDGACVRSRRRLSNCTLSSAASSNTIGRTLKKHSQAASQAAMGDPARRQCGVCRHHGRRPGSLHQRPLDPQRPLVCLDETSKQLIIDTRAPIPAKPGQPARHDYEYARNGVANLFMMFAPLEGWRHVKVTDRHTAIDYAHVLRDLSDTHFPDAAKIVLVQDNLNIHKPASLYEAFPAPEARRLVERFEWHYTPKHGSWLDMAESELGVLASQCLDRRIADKQILAHEVTAWQDHRNKHHAKADWQFTTANARVKLKRLYPQFE